MSAASTQKTAPGSEIVQNGNQTLREIAKDVPVSEISSPHIKEVLKRMKKALLSQDDGVALAAPQIDESLRIFIVSGRALALMTGSEEPVEDAVFINPVITKLSKETKMVEEGCLSVRYLYGKIKRSSKATVQAYNEQGKKFQRGGSGLLAQIFQHETDHLNGVLFIDSAIDLEDLPPEKITKK